MTTTSFDIALLTQKEYLNPTIITPYIKNVLLEDQLLSDALRSNGLTVTRTSWDNSNFDWSCVRFVVFRAIWDYFDRFNEFRLWFESCSQTVQFINPQAIIRWNIDKHYLSYLQQRGINIPPTQFIEQGGSADLRTILQPNGWQKAILKPAISGSARHTYLFDLHDVDHHQQIAQELSANESLLVQEFQDQILTKGEISLMLFAGVYSHAVLKNAKAGDFRVQDDHGGRVSLYTPSQEEIAFAEHAVRQTGLNPVYARVDVMWDNQNSLCVSELELIEPELWLRTHEPAANAMARAIKRYIF
jgi:glutathione synthase/RimK-type ligase-like ATP-grasp enzyme